VVYMRFRFFLACHGGLVLAPHECHQFLFNKMGVFAVLDGDQTL
jgi:hypothetical protein